jgi:hypothetical protein
MAKETPAEKARRLAASSRPVLTAETAQAPARAARQTSTKAEKVRITLDLAPALYRELNTVTELIASELGSRGQIRPEVLKVLIRQLIDDPAVQKRVIAELSVALSR